MSRVWDTLREESKSGAGYPVSRLGRELRTREKFATANFYSRKIPQYKIKKDYPPSPVMVFPYKKVRPREDFPTGGTSYTLRHILHTVPPSLLQIPWALCSSGFCTSRSFFRPVLQVDFY
jgi:hypothetical protein